MAATLLGLLFLVSILATLAVKGAGGISASVFTQVMRPPGSRGGLLQVAFFYLGELVEAAPAADLFTASRQKRTQDSITGRFG